MMDKEFYIIVNSLFNDTNFGYGEQKTENYNTGEAEFCKGCNLPISMLEWLPPYEIKVSKKRLGDFIYGSFTGFVVSKKFKERYERDDLVGLTDFEEVDIYHRNEKLTDRYFYPKISLINAFVDLELIDLENEALCDICQKGSSIINRICGVEFINKELINEDVFFTTALGQGQIFVSEKFKTFVEASDYENIKLLKASQFKWDSLNPVEY